MGIWKREATPEIVNKRWIGGMATHLDIKITEIGADFMRAEMPVTEKTVQPFDIMNGGASGVLAETIASVCSNNCLADPNQYAVGTHLVVHHLRPAPKGSKVFAEARAKHLGQKTHLWAITLTNAEGKTVAEATLATAILSR